MIILNNGGKVNSKTIRKKKDGEIIDVSIQAFPISLAENSRGYYVIYRDLTELEDAKRRYEKTKKRYENLFEKVYN